MQPQVIVVGGGMVGAACALGLGQLGLKVRLIEQTPIEPYDRNQPYDVRISAISMASVKLLQQLQAWQYIATQRLCPYRRLETWEIDGFSTLFDAQDLKLEQLGFMLENKLIQTALWQAFNANVQTSVAKIKEIKRNGEHWHFLLDQGEQFSAPLVIAADGANSQLRQIAGIGITGWQYRQDCLLIIVETELPQQDITWQQFFPTGPRAFLPLQGNQACLAWYDSPKRIAELKLLSPDKLASQIEQAFPARLGKIKVQNCASFSLTRRHCQQYYKQGIVLVGDAAHTINPLAGQGVNLGFKDVSLLLELAKKAIARHEAIHSETIWQRYQRERKPDNLLMQTGMDLFYKGFKQDLLPLKILRNSALLALDKITPLKKQILSYAIGGGLFGNKSL